MKVAVDNGQLADAEESAEEDKQENLF